MHVIDLTIRSTPVVIWRPVPTGNAGFLINCPGVAGDGNGLRRLRRLLRCCFRLCGRSFSLRFRTADGWRRGRIDTRLFMPPASSHQEAYETHQERKPKFYENY